MISEEILDEFLEHYGVKGMKWGQRKTNPDGSVAPGLIRNRNAPDASGVTRKQARVEISKINRKATRNVEDWMDSRQGAFRNKDIKDARKSLKYANRKYEDAVLEIKGKKGEVGRNATKVALAKAGAERYETAAKAAQRTTGEQIIDALFGGIDLATRGTAA